MRTALHDPRLRTLNLLSTISWPQAAMAALGLGIIIRLWVYLSGYAFWLDEAMVFLNIQNRSFAELTEPLDYNQMAPIGWLMMQKSMISIFGGSEYSMRFPALLFACLSMVICYQTAKQWMTAHGAFLTALLIALMPPVLIYAVALKPYVSDIFFAAAILAVTLECLREDKSSWVKLGLLFLIGTAGIFASLPSVIILASAGVTLALKAGLEKHYDELLKLSVLGITWLIIFAFVYLTFHGQPSEVTSWMRDDAWVGSMAPIPFTSLSSLIWYPSRLQNLMAYWFTDEGSFFALTFFVLGLLHLTLSSRVYVAVLLALPIIIALLVSMMGLYPLSSRLSVYLIPSTIFAVAFGFDFLVARSKEARFAAYLFGGIFCLTILWRVFSIVTAPAAPLATENVHPALQILTDQRKDDDMIYVYYGAIPTYWVYRDRYEGLRSAETLLGRSGRNDLDCFLLDAAALQSRGRVWALFSAHIWGNDRLKEDGHFLNGVDKIADVLVDHKMHDVRLVLLDFNRVDDTFRKRIEAIDIPEDATCRRYWSSPVPD